MVKRIAIIPARGGSKRLPRKNILEFFGKPLLAWTVEAARESQAFEHVIVSTEDREIAEIARSVGAEVPFLRESHHDDQSTASQATIAAVQQAIDHYQESYDVVAQLMPNCPLRTAADITGALTAFDAAEAEFQISCMQFGWMNPWWALQLDETGQGKPLFPEALKRRSQDLPPLYCPSGAIWIARCNALLEAGTFYGPGQRFEPMFWVAGIDIDNNEDLEFARAAFILRSRTH